jgi:DNA-binding protein H-NS
MTTLENLQAKIAKLQAQAEAITKKQLSTVLVKIRDLMEEHSLTLADIESHSAEGKRGIKSPEVKPAAKSAGEVQYLDRKSGATWTGKGRPPAWIANAKDRDKFLIDGSVDHLKTASKSAAKAGNYVRGPQEPKYRDPRTGATWSGRGRAPVWLAGAKDRTAFLVAGESNAASKAIAAKKVAGTKVASKKAAAKKATVSENGAPANKSPAKKTAVKKTVTKKAVAKKVTARSIAPVHASDESAA